MKRFHYVKARSLEARGITRPQKSQKSKYHDERACVITQPWITQPVYLGHHKYQRKPHLSLVIHIVDEDCLLMATGVAGTRPRGGLPNWAIASLLTVFVGASYLTIFRRVSKNDLEKELERELEEEAQRQAKEATPSA